jgi:hypothetical protein
MRKSLLLVTLLLAALATGRSYAAIVLTEPNGGENWGLGTYQFITWTGASGNVKIEVSNTGPGGPWLTIVASTPGAAGSFFWRVDSPAIASGTARIRITNLSPSQTDTSDANFTISSTFRPGPITVAVPGNGNFQVDVVVSAVSPDDPNGINPDTGTPYAHKYTYTIKNLDTLTSFPNSYLGFFQLANCDQRFSSYVPRLGTGPTNPNWTLNTWSVGTGNIVWTANNFQNDGVGPGTLPAQPKSTQIFCVYTNQEQNQGTLSVSVLHRTSSTGSGTTNSADFEYWTPGCPPDDGHELPEGCVHHYHMAQVYPVEVGAGGFVACDCFDIENLSCWAGATPHPIVGTGICSTERLALPGFLCLKTDADGNLDVNAFVTTGENGCATNPFIQAWSLTKVAAHAPKCPEIFHGYTITQIGDRIRTAWPLAYTTPGTTFTLNLMGEDRQLDGTPIGPYEESWTWEVVANTQTFCHLIDLFHTNTLSILEVPSIVGEDTYKALKACAETLLEAFPPGTDPETLDADQLNAIKEAIEECEAIILANTLFVDHLAKPNTMKYPYYQAYPKRQLPPNNAIVDPKPDGVDPDTGAHSSSGFIGIIDTFQNPVACKLLADLDYIAVKAGLRGP